MAFDWSRNYLFFQNYRAWRMFLLKFSKLLHCLSCLYKGCFTILENFLLQVWSLVRRFDQPQKYKPFIRRCIAEGNLQIGSLREVNVKTGLPATTSTERLELLDDEEHVLRVRIIGGDHRLRVFNLFFPFHSSYPYIPLWFFLYSMKWFSLHKRFN